VQPFSVAVTETVPTRLAPVALAEVKAGTFPLPLAARPIAVLLFTHVKVAPVGTLAKLVAATIIPGQTVSL
jgi:hypothetical protein